MTQVFQIKIDDDIISVENSDALKSIDFSNGFWLVVVRSTLLNAIQTLFNTISIDGY